jgi:hypothetical protein
MEGKSPKLLTNGWLLKKRKGTFSITRGIDITREVGG